MRSRTQFYNWFFLFMTYVATFSSEYMDLYNPINLLFSASQIPKSFLKFPNFQNCFYSNSLKETNNSFKAS